MKRLKDCKVGDTVILIEERWPRPNAHEQHCQTTKIVGKGPKYIRVEAEPHMMFKADDGWLKDSPRVAFRELFDIEDGYAVPRIKTRLGVRRTRIQTMDEYELETERQKEMNARYEARRAILNVIGKLGSCKIRDDITPDDAEKAKAMIESIIQLVRKP